MILYGGFSRTHRKDVVESKAYCFNLQQGLCMRYHMELATNEVFKNA